MAYIGDTIPRYTLDEPVSVASGDIFELVSGMFWTDATTWGLNSSESYTALNNILFWPSTLTMFYTEPFILPSGVLADLGGSGDTIVWTDGPNIPQTISTLFIIGV